MKETVLRYGFYAILAILILTAIHVFVLMPPAISYAAAEVVGYLTMTLSMVFVFFGIKHYRDQVNNGSLSFGEGLKIGLLIALGPAVFFSLFDLLYVKVINPGWTDEYYGHYVQEATKSTPASELPDKLKQIKDQREFFDNPVMLFLVMFVTVFIIGLIVSTISALTLRRQRKIQQ